MDAILFITNLFFLLLWLRLWKVGEHEFYFNPLLSAPTRLTDKVIDFLRPVLIGGSTSGIAAITLLFLLAFRGILLCSAGSDWTIDVGMSISRTFPVGNWPDCILFSLTDFVAFLVRLWGLAFLVALMTPVPRNDRITEAFKCFTLPFSLLPRLPMAVVIVGLNALLVLHLQHTGRPFTGVIDKGIAALTVTLNWQEPVQAIVQLGWLTALSLADILLFAYGAMMGVVLGSLFAAVTQNRGLQQLANEAVRFLLGGFSRRPVMIGMIDLTPLAYFFSMNILYGVVTSLLRQLIIQAPWK